MAGTDVVVTDSLVDRARLTEDEALRICGTVLEGHGSLAVESVAWCREAVDAATHKALWEVADWLKAEYGMRSANNPSQRLSYLLKAAGMERPT